MPTEGSKPVRKLTLKRSLPFVGLKESTEPREAQRNAGILMAAVALLGVFAIGDPLMNLTIAGPAFIAGCALQEWALWDRAYGGAE